ncbi:hypothetical protein ASPZODRAFT_17500 [Penicilliopsis zonata CBS 506.65]|uniref:SMP-30/Gluconolactonase/LRE-like region domain-containing protein n=1 Tax=Penicilliopsis zonata CBS 506.65 TaxID=1073090 RepID=A0A1L9SDR6_9EURO|nr:hypothetical protein ASPZODRAFT_17500 [Penicilliopsis zonata CBS 506.65]OJJ45282.1 hypothetical protein ASPZODRAFT_17500 [Penicilliopsis zonata CBS 506.65]
MLPKLTLSLIFAALTVGETVFQYVSNGTWLENLAVRPNNLLLTTRLDVPELWSIDPSTSRGEKLLEFPDALGAMGITPFASNGTTTDRYAVVTGNFSLSELSATPGSFSIWTVWFDESDQVQTIPFFHIPEAEFLNGITTFSDEIFLVADSVKGVIWKIQHSVDSPPDPSYSVAVADETMLPSPDQPVQIGINGVKVLNGYIYYTSTTRELLCRVPVDEQANPTGAVEVLLSGVLNDDFIIDDTNEVVYIATNPQNTILKASNPHNDGDADYSLSLLAGEAYKLDLAGVTALQFSRDRSVLYATTSGAQIGPILGTLIEPAKVVSINLS